MSSVSQFCFGSEHELAPARLRDDGVPDSIDNEHLYGRIQEAVVNSGCPYLPGAPGIVTPYGRLYLETTGNHVEVATAPRTSPLDAVETEVKLLALVTDALGQVREATPGANLLKNNRDYVSGATWGAHESYAVRVDLDTLQAAMIPFLISRQMVVGSGTVQDGRYWLSARAAFMKNSTGGTTTSERAIYSTHRDEPLMKQGEFSHRLHLIVGDSLMSQFGQYLKLGMTALVIRAAELDPHIGDAVALGLPVRSLRAFSLVDPDRGPIRLHPALLRIQRHYLRAVGDMLEKHDMPRWCEKLWFDWAEVLAELESDPMALSTRLDAYIKFRLFNHFLKRRNKSWEDVLADEELRGELELYDVQYHALSGGTFNMLDSRGAFRHRVCADVKPGDEQEPYVIASPPREAQRSRLIKEFSGNSDYMCTWTMLSDTGSGRFLKMSDLFSDTGHWRRVKEAMEPDGDPLPSFLRRARRRRAVEE
jgi:pup-ligase protein